MPMVEFTSEVENDIVWDLDGYSQDVCNGVPQKRGCLPEEFLKSISLASLHL